MAQIKKGQDIELDITGIAFGGKGLAKVDGFAIFVAQSVPGDRVRVRITRKKKNFAEARVLERMGDSKDRVDAPCPYSGTCGGCTWQFLKYEAQLVYKQQHVLESIQHIGMIQDALVRPAVASPLTFGYRNKMEFSCSDRRWLMNDELGNPDLDIGFALGLHVPGTFHKVLDTQACLLQPDLGNDILADIRKYMKGSGRPVYGLRSHEGFWRFLVLRHSVAHDRWMVNLVTKTEDLDAVKPLAELLVAKYPAIVSVVNNITARKSGVAVGEREVWLAGQQIIKDRIGEYEFEISSNSFFQTNTRGAELLYDMVRKYASLTGNETVIDLYSGTGTIPIVLSNAAKEIIGFEIVEGAVRDALMNCHHNGINNCRFVAGDIRENLSGIDINPEVMVIDPPRAGMHKEVVKQVLRIRPARIVYVSCNPATLARDLEMMKESYLVDEVQPVDLFPHTFHVESVARLSKI